MTDPPTQPDEPTAETDPLAVVVLLMMLPPLLAWAGIVFACLWSWFIVPLGVDPVSTWHAGGLFVMIGWVAKYRQANDRPLDRKRCGNFVGRAILAPLLPLAVGGLFHWIMVGAS